MGITGDPDRRLLDREPELAGLERAFREVAAGHGRGLVCEGPAGSGKTALLRRARRLAATAGLIELRAVGGELERGFPFGVCRQLLEPALSRRSELERAALLAGVVSPAASILGLDGSASAVSADGYAAVHALYGLISRLAAEHPLLMIVDDAHWADPSSLRALDYLARRLEDLPVAVLIAARPDEPGSPSELLDRLSGAASTRLSTGPLSAEAIATLVREHLPDADDEVCAAWHETCGGNPLYALELVRAFADRSPAPDAAAVRSASVRSLGERVLRRADQVAASAPALVRAMAVLGDGTRLDAAAEVAEVASADAGTIAHELARLEVLAGEDPLAFVHPLIRASIYDATPARDRHRLHRAAADWLGAHDAAATAVATHLCELPPDRDPAVAGALVSAAEEALARAAPDEAAAWFERALAEQADEPPRAHLLARLGTARAIQRDPSCIALLQKARGETTDPAQRAQLAVLLADVCAQSGAWDEAMEMIAAAEADAPADDPALVADVAAIRAAATLFDPSRVADFDARRDGYLELSEGPSWGAHALAALLASEAAHRGDPAAAARLCARALEGGRLLSERGAGAWASAQVMWAVGATEDYELALATFAAVKDAAERSGATVPLVAAIGYGGWMHARQGDLTAADESIAALLELARDAELLMAVTTGAWLMLEVLREREVDPSVRDLIEQVEMPAAFMATASGAMINEARAALAVRAGDRRRAIACLEDAGAIYAALRFGPLLSPWRSTLALLLPGAERERARTLAAEELALARAAGQPRAVGIALRAVGLLDDDPEAGLVALRESVMVFEASPARLELARSLVELGAALRRSNQRAQARGPLVAAIELSVACGATRLAGRARDELRAAGGRRRREAISGASALTASERRVVELAASGVSNVQIGEQLYVSLKTVETHLSRAYGKLGLAGAGSRARLAEALARTE